MNKYFTLIIATMLVGAGCQQYASPDQQDKNTAESNVFVSTSKKGDDKKESTKEQSSQQKDDTQTDDTHKNTKEVADPMLVVTTPSAITKIDQYLNSTPVIDTYQSLSTYTHDDMALTLQYPETYKQISDSSDSVVLSGWLKTPDTDDVIVAEVSILNLHNLKEYEDEVSKGAITVLKNIRSKKEKGKKGPWTDTENISAIYEVTHPEFKGYAFDHTRDRGQHLGLPIVRTTITHYVFVNKRGEMYKMSLVAHNDSKVIFETLRFQ